MYPASDWSVLQHTAGPYIRVKLRKTQWEQMFSGLPLIADIAQYSRHVSKVPQPVFLPPSDSHELGVGIYREMPARARRSLVGSLVPMAAEEFLLGQWLGGECRAAVCVLARSRHCVAISAILTWEDKMRRRDFVFGFSGAALAMLDIARAQQVARVWRVGNVGIEPRDRGQYLFDAFSQKLAEFGYQQGRNIDLTEHFAEARIEKIEEFLVPLVVNLDLLVIWSTIGLIAAKKVVPTALPTVFLGVGDPVRVGAVQSLSRPGGNMTGVTYESATETWAKRIELLKEIVPNLDRVGVLKAGNDPNSAYAMASLEPWLPALGVTLVAVDFTSTEELDAAFSEMMRKNVKGLLVISGALTFVNGKRISELALEHRMPSVHGFRETVALGGLVSLGPELAAIARQGARLADKIMKGEKPANIPVEQPTAYEVWLNLRTARVLSITVPASVTARADRVIE